MKASKTSFLFLFTLCAALVFSTGAPTALAQKSDCSKCVGGECRNYGPLAPPLFHTCLDFGSFCAEDDECPLALATLDVAPSGSVNGIVAHQSSGKDGSLELRTCGGALISVRREQTALAHEIQQLETLVI